jgi:hypothetical protein
MVRALLDGRKTQTRRIIKPQPVPFLVDDKPCEVALEHIQGEAAPRIRLGRVITCQDVRYVVGDRLWVREAWRCNGWATDVATIFYRANEGDGYTAMCEQYPVAGRKPLRVTTTWRPGIHMPRWASRLTLEVSGVKIERLQDISEADAAAEGADPIIDHGTGSKPYLHRIGFEHLWCRINGETAWIENPFVAAITFRVVKVNVDAPEALAA